MKFKKTIIQKNYRKHKEKKVVAARLYPTRYDNSKGNRIGPSLFYTSELHTKYKKKSPSNLLGLLNIKN